MSDLPPPSEPLAPPSLAPPAAPLPAVSPPTGPSGYAPAAVGHVPPHLGGAYYGIGLVILLSVVTFGIWTFLWVWRTAEDLKRYNGDGLGGPISLVLRFFVWPALLFTIPNEVQHMYERDGRRSPVSTAWGFWVLLPLVGWIIWYVNVQRALNDFWLSKGAQPG